MSLKSQAAAAGVLRRGDIDMLKRVLEKTLPVGAVPLEREAHAVTLINLFKAGLVTEDRLVKALSGTSESDRC